VEVKQIFSFFVVKTGNRKMTMAFVISKFILLISLCYFFNRAETIGNINFTVTGEDTVLITSGGTGFVLQEGNIKVTIPSGIVAETPSGNLTTFNLSLCLFSVDGVSSPPGENNLNPLYAFAFAVNGQITPEITFIDTTNGLKMNLTTIVQAPNTWTTWTWFGGSFNGINYTGGSYKFSDNWIYGENIMVNTQFVKPVLWIFQGSPTPLGEPLNTVPYNPQVVFGLMPISSSTVAVHNASGAVITLGPVLAIIPSGTTVVQNSTVILSSYNFSVIIYSTTGLSETYPGETPYFAFGYAINGQETEEIEMSQPFVTIVSSPTVGATLWTDTYQSRMILGKNIIINLTFVMPVPWVITLDQLVPTPTTSSSTWSSSSLTSSPSSSNSYSSTTSNAIVATVHASTSLMVPFVLITSFLFV